MLELGADGLLTGLTDAAVRREEQLRAPWPIVDRRELELSLSARRRAARTEPRLDAHILRPGESKYVRRCGKCGRSFQRRADKLIARVDHAVAAGRGELEVDVDL